MAETDQPLSRVRSALAEAIVEEARETAKWTGRARFSPAVMAAMTAVPRHLFVDPAQQALAYENRPLAIGHGQTISQPFIVALISDLAEIQQGCRVLEVGTGCGYQAAVLAAAGAEVVTIERIPELANSAAERLAKLGYDQVTVHCGDGTLGWPEQAPYDAIVVSAAVQDAAPPALIEQLALGGRLVLPIEKRGDWRDILMNRRVQELVVLVKEGAGKITRRTILPVAFVPLISETD